MPVMADTPRSAAPDTRCPSCGYDRAAPNAGFVTPCPECGDADSTRRLLPWPSRARLAFAILGPSSVFLIIFIFSVFSRVEIAIGALALWAMITFVAVPDAARTLARRHLPANARAKWATTATLIAWACAGAIVAAFFVAAFVVIQWLW